jgi:hypothetical protein
MLPGKHSCSRNHNPAIAKKALGNYEVEGDKRVETLIALLKNKIGNDQEGQYLLSQIIKELTKKEVI